MTNLASQAQMGTTRSGTKDQKLEVQVTVRGAIWRMKLRRRESARPNPR